MNTRNVEMLYLFLRQLKKRKQANLNLPNNGNEFAFGCSYNEGAENSTTKANATAIRPRH